MTTQPDVPIPMPAAPRPVVAAGGGRIVSGVLYVVAGAVGIVNGVMLTIVVTAGRLLESWMYSASSALNLGFLVLIVIAHVLAATITRGPDGIVGRSTLATVGFLALAVVSLLSLVLPYAMSFAGAGSSAVALSRAFAVLLLLVLVLTAVAVLVQGSAGGVARWALFVPAALELLSVGSNLLPVPSFPAVFVVAPLGWVVVGIAYAVSRGRLVRV